MPYHEEAIGEPWQRLDRRLQTLLLGFMRVAGGGLLGAGIGSAILLLIPFRTGETWSQFAIPGVGLVTALPTLYAAILIRSRTQAHTPVVASAAAVGLIVIGFILSML